MTAVEFMTETKPYRPNVGIALFNAAGQVLIGRRFKDDGPEIILPGLEWQMPQGGIDTNENPRDAVMRELWEETGVVNADYLGETDWLAIGDAAATQDPLSSEGILVAMESGLEGAAASARVLRGDREALAAAAARRETGWLGYLGQRDHYYDMERRWLDAPFWQRRGRRELRQSSAEQRSVA